MNNIERKLNYLLTKVASLTSQEDPEILKWLADNQASLETVIDVKDVFANEGLTIKDLVSQLEYGNEYRTLIQFQHEYKTINDTNYVGASVGTFSFENSMYPQFLQDIKKLPSTLNDMPPLTNGILLIPLNSVIIKSTKSTNYFSSNGQNTSLTVDQTVTGPLITISVNSITKSIQGINSQMIGMNQLTSVIQQRILILPFIQIDDIIEISNLEAVLDTENNDITLITSKSNITLEIEDFVDFINDLPKNIKMITNVFSTYFDENYLMFKQLYISTLLQELVPQITDYYAQTYGNNITYGLYGQGSAVSISQLYNLASATLRREEVSYNLTQSSQNIKPCFFSSKFVGENDFQYNLPFTSDQVWCVAKPRSTSSVNNTWRWENFPIIVQGCTTENGQVVLSQDLKTQRPLIDKIDLVKTSSTKNTKTKLWFEERISNINNVVQVNNTRVAVIGNEGTVIQPSDYKINGIAGGSITDQLNGVAEFYGINLLVYNNQQTDTTYDLAFTKDYTIKATKELYVVLYPEDLSSESTSPLQMDVTWMQNGVKSHDVIQLEPQRIEYGTISVNAYVGLLSISDASYTFSIESSATFTKGTGNERNGAYYEGVQLASYRRTDINKNAFNVPSSDTDTIPVARLTNSTTWAVKVRPGSVYKTDNAMMNTYLANPPFSWQSWNGKRDDNYISLYLSTGSKIRSSVTSPLKMEVQSISFVSKSYEWEKELTFPFWGYNISGVLAQYNGSVNIMKTEYATNLRLSPITGWMNKTNVNLNQYQIVSLEATGTELILPSGIYNQYNLSESITNLQTSVAFLALYADYLKYLLDALDERVTIVEKTMDDVIKTLNEIITAITPKQQSIGGQILSFISTSVGMFFPLTGLAIAIVGQVYDGIVKMQDGNITTGVMDMTVGCLMSVLGLRKFKQRMDRKYGTTTQVTPPSPPAVLPSYDELYGPPGYNSVGTELVPKSSTTMKLSSGTIKSADIYCDEQTTAVNTILLQEGLHNLYRQQRQIESNNRAIVGKVSETWDNKSQLIGLEYGLYEIYHGAENEIISELISETDFSAMLSTSISSVNYVKWMYVYANLGVQLSNGLGFDEEVIQTIALANFSKLPQTQRISQDRFSNKYNLFKHKEITNRFKRLRTLDYNLQSTKLSITDFNRALNPYINDTDSQAQILENVYDYLSGLIHNG